MGRRPLVLLTTTLVLTFGGSALAAEPPYPAGYSVTCSVSLAGAGCFVERPVFVLGAFEVAVGFDARAAWAGEARGYASPFLVAGYYTSTWSVWTEVATPGLQGIPVIGKPDWWRLGFTYRIP